MYDIECVNPQADILNVGNYGIYPDSVKIMGNSSVNEQATVSGGTAVTNRNVKSTLITFCGRLIRCSDFTGFVLYVENILKNKTPLNLTHGGFCFNTCLLKSYFAEIKENIAEIKLVFTANQLSEVTADGSQN